MTIEEIMAKMKAIIDGAEDRSLTDDEAGQYEALETDLQNAKRDNEIRMRNTAYNTVRTPMSAPVATVTREARPYNVRRITNRITGESEYIFSNDNPNSFAGDLRAMFDSGDAYGNRTEQGQRVMVLLKETFKNAGVASTDVDELNPTIQRPDLFVDQRDYRTPLIDAIGRGAPPNGIQPFTFPKFNGASGLVGDHTEGTEPSQGTYTTTSQTVTPSAISGEISLTRETWDMGGTPAVSGIVFNQMVRGYREGLEQSAATFLNTLTAATDIALDTGATTGQAPTSLQLSQNWETALAGLQFTRGYDFSVFVLEQNLYQAFAAARGTDNRPMYPILNPVNANGTATARFRTLDLAGVIGIPSWALTATAGSANNSWLFDPSTVFGWYTAPERLEFPGRKPSDGSYAPVAYVTLGIWGYKAFANSDIAGVRQVIYDTTA